MHHKCITNLLDLLAFVSHTKPKAQNNSLRIPFTMTTSDTAVDPPPAVHTFDLLSSIKEYDRLVAQLSSSTSPSRETGVIAQQLFLCTRLWLQADQADEERLLTDTQRVTLRQTCEHCATLLSKLKELLPHEENFITGDSLVPDDIAMEYRGLGTYHWIATDNTTTMEEEDEEIIDLSAVDLAAEEAELLQMAHTHVPAQHSTTNN